MSHLTTNSYSDSDGGLLPVDESLARRGKFSSLKAFIDSMPVDEPRKIPTLPPDGHEEPEQPNPAEFDYEAYFREAETKRRIQAAGIPERYLSRTIEGFKTPTQGAQRLQSRVLRYSREVMGLDGLSEPSGILLWGPAGTGKTHLACAALITLIQSGAHGLYLSPVEWFTALRSTFGGGGEMTEGEMLDEAGDVQVLLIDDLGVGKEGQEWQAEKIYQLINRRVNNGRPTIITTNLSFPDGLASHVGERVTSRIFEICVVLSTNGMSDWRDARKRQ